MKDWKTKAMKISRPDVQHNGVDTPPTIVAADKMLDGHNSQNEGVGY